MTPGGTREVADWLITRPEVTCVQFAGDGLLAMAAPAPRACLGPLLQLEQLGSIQVGTRRPAVLRRLRSPRLLVTDLKPAPGSPSARHWTPSRPPGDQAIRQWLSPKLPPAGR